MEIKVAKRDLKDALGFVGHSMASSGSEDDITTHFLFRVQGDADSDRTLQLLAYTGHLFATAAVVGTQIDTESNDPKMFTIHGKRLRMWLDNVPDAPLTLVYSAEEASTVVSVPASDQTLSQTFSSLDPSKFELWDDLVGEAELKGGVRANQLRQAFDYVRNFTGKDDNKPHLLTFEARNGGILATDTKAAALVTIGGLDKARFRIHRSDASSILASLAKFGESEIGIYETDRAVIFRRDDGFLFGETGSELVSLKSITVSDGDNHHWWEVPVDDLKARIKLLRAGADWEDPRLRLRFEDGKVELAMEIKDSGRWTTILLSCTNFGTQEGAEDLPERGFYVSYQHLTELLDRYEGDTIKFGVNQRIKGDVRTGFLRFSWSQDDIKYLTVIVWLRGLP